ncbi:UNVERIFIED_CONTAM: Salicylic acid-binding protein 2 [Sesamum radiatum]|uniref:Salicylic acid-binding protein 2 n=1 Tax=Sesamum radiatum TaxID=300843 RepID=A0AAW2P326_SESRA
MADAKQQTHIILVHGAGHGAWCWYKLKPLLEAAGHRVTALDLAASGTDKRTLEELHTFADYSQPLLELMASIPPEEKVVLVGHSLGGMNLAFAMDMFPEKIKVAVFVAAVMPDSIHKPSYVLDQDVALANMLARPCCTFLQDLSNKSPFSKEGFGSVKRVFIVCPEDQTIPPSFQRWQIENTGVDQVKEIENADHMPMLSKPRELCHCLLEIANYYA